MVQGEKKSGVLPQILVGIVLAICVGGSSPWWLKEIKELINGPPSTEAGANERKGTIDTELEKLDKNDLAKRQRDLETELNELKRNQGRNQGNPQTTEVNIGGTWRSGEDTYTFVQTGGGLTLSVYEGEVGMNTMIGNGSIAGKEITLAMQTALETTGTFKLTVNDTGNSISGVYTDQTGFQFSCLLTR